MIDERLWATADAMRTDRGIVLRLILANLGGVALVGVQTTVISRPAAGGGDRFDNDLYIAFGVAAAYLAVAIPVAVAASNRLADRAFSWTSGRRWPTITECIRALRFPWDLTQRIAAWWLGGAVLFGGLQTLFGNSTAYALRFGIGVALGGLVTAALSFLLLERFNRPVFTLALAGGPPPPGAVLGLERRLVLTWVLGAAVPLVLAGSAPMGLTDSQRAGLTVSLAVVSATGLVAGYIVTRAATRTVVEPLAKVRDAQRRVQEGGLDIVVTVDDGGEIGLLQVGFNRMVEGLRDRQRLQDLFGRYVGEEVARTALARGVELGGERTAATALFVDLVASTAMARRLEPESVVEVLNDVFRAVVACVIAEGGWVNKFEGDGALCVFGPPGNDAEHAARGLRAARAMRAALLTLAERHTGLDAGIGVSSGEVVAGNIGAEDRYEYTVIGDPVNEAARLTEEAKHVRERVLASERAVTSSGGEAQHWRPYRRLTLRGRDEPTDTYVPVTRASDREAGMGGEGVVDDDVAALAGPFS